MQKNGVAYEAKYYTTSEPGSDDSWFFVLKCDGTQAGEPSLLSIPSLNDPISLKVTGWPSYLAMGSNNRATDKINANYGRVDSISTAKALLDKAEGLHTTVVIEVGFLNRDLFDTTGLTAQFSKLIDIVSQVNSNAAESSIIINEGVLNRWVDDKGGALSSKTLPVSYALKAALGASSKISISDINNLISDDLSGWVRAQNLIIKRFAPSASFGWSLNLDENWILGIYSGQESTWKAGTRAMADLMLTLETYDEGDFKPDFLAFSNSGYLDDNGWNNAMVYIKQISDFVKAPALLWDLPTSSNALNYFFGKTSADRQLRQVSYSNIFGLLFNGDEQSSNLQSNINSYQNKGQIPLYYASAGGETKPLTTIRALNYELSGISDVMDDEVFLYELPAGNVWAPSTIYKWDDFLAALNSMHNVGVADNTFWLIDPNADDATNTLYAKVAIAAFLSQSMQETIRYDACDENNWAQVRYGSPVDYPMNAACGQLGQMYADYGTNPTSGLDHPYSCPRNSKMEITARTHASWYGAPGPMFVVPDAVLMEKGLLVNGNVGAWSNSGHCMVPPEAVDDTVQAWNRKDCETYVGQKAGGNVWNGLSDSSVEGCGWWGRGVIQTTGRQNFGTLNHFVGRSHIDPAIIGQTIDDTTVEAAPASPLYADLDLCSNPEVICSSTEHTELKWIAGLFFWVSSVQSYSDDGGEYEDWNYYTELKKFVDDGLVGTAFVDAVSGIVNRGCPDKECPVSGEVHAMDERRRNFDIVLEKMGVRRRNLRERRKEKSL